MYSHSLYLIYGEWGFFLLLNLSSSIKFVFQKNYGRTLFLLQETLNRNEIPSLIVRNQKPTWLNCYCYVTDNFSIIFKKKNICVTLLCAMLYSCSCL